MANAKISQLPAAGAITGAELVPVVQGGTTSQTTVDDILTGTTLTSVTLVTPALGTPVSGTLTSCTGLPVSTGVAGLGANVAAFLATPSSANLASAVTGETGTGALVFADTPTLVTPVLGTPTSGTLTNCTIPVGGVTGLGTGVATALAVNVGSAGAPVVNGGALGTPASGTLTNCTFPTLNQNTTGSAGSLLSGAAVPAPVLTLRVTTAAALGAIANAINTAGKAQGAVVYNSDDNLLYVANGALAADTWSPSDGGADITPA